jgi:hypothetical protein
METGDEVRAHLNDLQDAVWELAAISVALGARTGAGAPERQAAERVLVETGLMIVAEGSVRPSPGLRELIADGAIGVAAETSTDIMQSARLLSGGREWSDQDDAAILAQGQASAQLAQPFKSYAVPLMDGLGELLSGPAPVILDVGVGVGGLAVAFCEVFPGARVVGLDLMPRAIELARGTVAESGMDDRIELRFQDVAELDDCDRFCLGWVPAPFLGRPALDAGLPRVVDALVPGGWIMLAHGKLRGGGLAAALTRLRTVTWGGTAMDDDEAQDILAALELEQIATLPTPDDAPALTIGRRPRRPRRT